MITFLQRNFGRAASAAAVVAPLALSSPAARAGDAPAKCRTFKPIEAMTAVLGSKSALAYFVNDNGACRVALMVSERFDPAEAPRSASRLNLRLEAGQSVSLDSEEGDSLNIACGRGAAELQVTTAPREKIMARERNAGGKLCALGAAN